MAEVSVQFLGTGDAFGSGGRLQTCFYVDAGAVRFLLDCGTSSLIALKRRELSTSQVDVILLTHLHADGRMTYKWWPSRGAESQGNNMIRQWMATAASLKTQKPCP